MLNDILAKEEYVFRINSSTEASSYSVINEILKAVDNRLSVGGTFCDLEKEFDCDNYGNVLDKLEFSRISGKFL